VPVRSVDGRTIGEDDGEASALPGPLTAQLAGHYHALAARSLERRADSR
jgi:hypothetical protein